jgi:protein-S-isoprenylcysteine O-methyltransferase Ste14
MMNPSISRAVMLAATVATIAIRWPHGARRYSVKVTRNLRTRRERALMGAVVFGFIILLIWIGSPAWAFADFALHPAPFVAGIACLVVSLWLFHRSHADLGLNWSPTLEMRESHQLVTRGVYRAIRHPMYTSLLLYGIGQALVVPNWFAGPLYLAAMATLVALRLGVEERMMLDAFGEQYAAYMRSTKRLIPGIW